MKWKRTKTKTNQTKDEDGRDDVMQPTRRTTDLPFPFWIFSFCRLCVGTTNGPVRRLYFLNGDDTEEMGLKF